MMTLDEMRLAVCDKLPELIHFHSVFSFDGLQYPYWRCDGARIYWPTEGLQICHEAEKLLTMGQRLNYLNYLDYRTDDDWKTSHATYEQRLEALCRVWWPERF